MAWTISGMHRESVWPYESNTGVPAGAILATVPMDVSSGTGWHYRDDINGVSIDANNVTLSGLDIPGGIYNPSGHTGLTVTQCLVRCIGFSDSSVAVQLGAGGHVVDTQIGGGADGKTRTRSVGILAPGTATAPVLIERVNIFKVTHCIHHISGYTTVTDSWLHDVSMGDTDVPGMSEDHTETVFVFEGQHITYQHCRLQSGNSAVFFAQNNAGTGVGTGNLVINRCWFEAVPPRNDQWSNAAIIIENKTIAGPVVVTNNLIDGPAIGTAFPYAVWEVGLAGEVPADVSTVAGNFYPDGSSADSDFSFTPVVF